ncbi:MAG: hypothetical protein KHZ78_05290 [Peptoniphilus sp. oral taxon 375]|nr:hypothetical protein [Peptoniphilus sp. oral taxon 375]
MKSTLKKVLGGYLILNGIGGFFAITQIKDDMAMTVMMVIVSLALLAGGILLITKSKPSSTTQESYLDQDEKALIKEQKRLAKEEAKALKNKIPVRKMNGEIFYVDTEDETLENISKKVDLSVVGKWKKYFLVDDINEEIAFVQNWKAVVFNYRDILNYEYKEDGEKIIGGKKLATLAGGLTFGVLGAMAGASGNKKIKEKLDSMAISINLNSLNDARIEIELLPSKTKRNSMHYKNALDKANEIIHALNYATNKIK